MPKNKPPRKKRKPPLAVAGKTNARRESLPPLPDPRTMERHVAGLVGSGSDGAVNAAQRIMYDAWDAADPEKRVDLALKALEVSPLCADAYVLLAEEIAPDLSEAIVLYAKGVAAGENALGERAFKDDVGHFWGLLETRPYMRARSSLAQALWAVGKGDDAIAHFRDMLRLNPNDNQGIRYLLATCLLNTGRDADLDELLERYDGDSSAAWTYTQALAAFRREGDTEPSRGLLDKALESNARVPEHLLSEKKLPPIRSQYLQMGGEDEAIEYARDCRAAWKATPGAPRWLREFLSRRPTPRRGRGQL